MKILLQNVLHLLFFVPYQFFSSATETVTVGLVFSGMNYDFDLLLNYTWKTNLDRRVNFESYIQQHSNIGFLEDREALCGMLNAGDGLAAVISLESSTPPILESMYGYFEVPYIMISWRPRNTKPANTFLNFFPEADLFAHGLAEVVKSLRWNSFVILYESEERLITLQEVLKLQDFKENGRQINILLKQLDRGPDYRSLLKEIKKSSFNNIILDCKTEHIAPILRQAKEQNLLNRYNNYFLTSLDAHTLDYAELNTQANITAISLIDYNSEYFNSTLEEWRTVPTLNSSRYISVEGKKIKTETILLYHAAKHIIRSIDVFTFLQGDRMTYRINCYKPTKSKNGYPVAAYMKQIEPDLTISGPIKFDGNGNRIDFDLHLIDVLKNEIIADWHASSDLLELRRNISEMDPVAVANLQDIVAIVSSRGNSSRMVVSIWWFSFLLLACSYTANLAAFLTKDRIKPTEALSKQTRIKYGLLYGGSTMEFFKSSNFPTYQRMWVNMILSNFNDFERSTEEAVKKVQMSNDDYAFLMESTQNEYEIQNKCDLKQIGTFLDTKTYVIIMALVDVLGSLQSGIEIRLQCLDNEEENKASHHRPEVGRVTRQTTRA